MSGGVVAAQEDLETFHLMDCGKQCSEFEMMHPLQGSDTPSTEPLALTVLNCGKMFERRSYWRAFTLFALIYFTNAEIVTVHIGDQLQARNNDTVHAAAANLHALAQDLHTNYLCLLRANPFNFELRPGDKIKVPEACCHDYCHGPICSRRPQCRASASAARSSTPCASTQVAVVNPGQSTSSSSLTSSTNSLLISGGLSDISPPAGISTIISSLAYTSSDLLQPSMAQSVPETSKTSVMSATSIVRSASTISGSVDDSAANEQFSTTLVLLSSSSALGSLTTSSSSVVDTIVGQSLSPPQPQLSIKATTNSQGQTVLLDATNTLTLPVGLSSVTTFTLNGHTVTFSPSISKVFSEESTHAEASAITQSSQTSISSTSTAEATSGLSAATSVVSLDMASAVTGASSLSSGASTFGTSGSAALPIDPGASLSDTSVSYSLPANTASGEFGTLSSHAAGLGASSTSLITSSSAASTVAGGSSVMTTTSASSTTAIIVSAVVVISTSSTSDVARSTDLLASEGASSSTQIRLTSSSDSSTIESPRAASDSSFVPSSAGLLASQPSASLPRSSFPLSTAAFNVFTITRDSTTVISKAGFEYTVPPDACFATWLGASGSPVLTYSNPTRTCGVESASSSAVGYFLEPLLQPLESEPPGPGAKLPCTAWFFLFCIRWDNFQFFGFKIDLPPGPIPPGPPPRITFPPSLSITVNTIGTLPSWPSISVDPKGTPSFSPKPTDCVTKSGAICLTSTSYAVTVAGAVTKTTGSQVLSTCNTIYGCDPPASGSDTTLTSVTSSDTTQSAKSSSTSTDSSESQDSTKRSSTSAATHESSQLSKSASTSPELQSSALPSSISTLSSVISSCASTTVTDCSTACSAVSTTGSLSTTCYSTTCSRRVGCSATASSTASTSTFGCLPRPPWPALPAEIPVLGDGGFGGYVAITGWTSPLAATTYTETDDSDDVSTSSSVAAPSSVSTTVIPTLNTIESRSGSFCAVSTTVADCVVGPPCGAPSLSCASWVATARSTTPITSLNTIESRSGSSCAVSTTVADCVVGPPCGAPSLSCASWVATTSSKPPPPPSTSISRPSTTSTRVLQTSPLVCHPSSTPVGISSYDTQFTAFVFCEAYRQQTFGAGSPDLNVVLPGDKALIRYVIHYLEGCKATSDAQDTFYPQNNDKGVTCLQIMSATFDNCNNGGTGGYMDIGCLRYTMIAPGDPT